MNRPNILFIMTDQHNARCMSCAGEPLLRTPNMDRLAQEGVRFTSAYANSAHCGPSRISFLTGMYEHTHKRHRNEDEPPDNLNPITSLLKNNGYETAFIGKGHLGIRWPRREFDYHKFDYFTDAFEDDPLSCDYFRFLVENGVADKFELLIGGHGWPVKDKTSRLPGPSALPMKYSEEAWVGDETVKYLRNRNRDIPFYAFVSFQRPHNPVKVPEPYDSMYDPEKVTLPENARDDFATKPLTQRKAAVGMTLAGKKRGEPHRPRGEADLKKSLALYYGLVSLIDYQIGRILKELEDEGVLDNTIVIFTADHGDFAAEHGFMYKNLGFYECIHRIPLLLRYPRFAPRGTVFRGMVESVDLYPTIAELLDIGAPASVQGKSFCRAVAENGPWEKRAAIAEHVKSFTHVSMRTERYRITVDATRAGDDESELYDHALDPGEMVNVWGDPGYREAREELLLDMVRYILCPEIMHGKLPPGWQPRYYPGNHMPEWSENIRALQAGTAKWSEISGKKGYTS